jgi:hypothetical protein
MMPTSFSTGGLYTRTVAEIACAFRVDADELNPLDAPEFVPAGSMRKLERSVYTEERAIPTLVLRRGEL